MSSKAWVVLLLSGCATSPVEQVAVPPSTEPAPVEPAAPVPAGPIAPVAPAPVAPAPSALTAPTPAVTAPNVPPGVPYPGGPAPIEKLPGAVWPPPGGWDPPPCELEASTALVKRGAVYEVKARLRNRTKKTMKIEVPDRCPQGPAVFHGLGESYDYYDTCAAGACTTPRDPVRFSIAPGQSITVATIRVAPAGHGCNRPLEPGAYSVGFGISTRHLLCGGPAAEFELAAAPEKPRAPSPAKKCPPPLACGIACPGGNFARDENGCSTCGCANGPSGTLPSEPGRRPPTQ